MSAAWTAGDGSVTNAIEGAAFELPYGTKNVKVIFTPELTYELVGDAVLNLGRVAADIVFGRGERLQGAAGHRDRSHRLPGLRREDWDVHERRPQVYARDELDAAGFFTIGVSATKGE